MMEEDEGAAVPVPPSPFEPGDRVSYRDTKGRVRCGFTFVKSDWRVKQTKQGATNMLMYRPGGSCLQLPPAGSCHLSMGVRMQKDVTKKHAPGSLQKVCWLPGSNDKQACLSFFTAGNEDRPASKTMKVTSPWMKVPPAAWTGNQKKAETEMWRRIRRQRV